MKNIVKKNSQIKKMRKISGMSQEDVATICGCSRSYIAQLERGEKKLKSARENIRVGLDEIYTYTKFYKKTSKKGLIFILKRIINKLFHAKP